MFKTRRQRRALKLLKWTPRFDYGEIAVFYPYAEFYNPQPPPNPSDGWAADEATLASRWSDLDLQASIILNILWRADHDPEFAHKLDRLLVL